MQDRSSYVPSLVLGAAERQRPSLLGPGLAGLALIYQGLTVTSIVFPSTTADH